MSSPLFQRKRAERFAQLVDEAGGARRHHVRSQVDDELQGLVAVTGRVSDLPLQVEAHEEFRDGLRAMLMAVVEREGIGTTAVNPEPEPSPGPRGLRIVRAAQRPGGQRSSYSRRTRARGAIVVGLAAGTLALSGMSAASGDAIPGDALYGVKRQTERAQLALAGSDISRGQLYLEFAKTRLNEAEAVKGDLAGFSAVLTDLDSETQQGTKLLTTTAIDRKDAAALDALDAFTTAQRDALVNLRDRLAGATHTRVGQSIQLLDDIAARSKSLRPLVPCGNGVVSSGDSMGPLPRTQCRAQPGGPGPTIQPGNAPRRLPVDGTVSSPVTEAPAPIQPPAPTTAPGTGQPSADESAGTNPGDGGFDARSASPPPTDATPTEPVSSSPATGPATDPATSAGETTDGGVHHIWIGTLGG